MKPMLVVCLGAVVALSGLSACSPASAIGDSADRGGGKVIERAKTGEGEGEGCADGGPGCLGSLVAERTKAGEGAAEGCADGGPGCPSATAATTGP